MTIQMKWLHPVSAWTTRAEGHTCLIANLQNLISCIILLHEYKCIFAKTAQTLCHYPKSCVLILLKCTLSSSSPYYFIEFE